MKRICRIALLDSFVESIAENDLALKQRLRLFKTASFITLLVIIGFTFQILIILPEPSFIFNMMAFSFVILLANYFLLPYHKNTALAFIAMLTTMLILVHLDTYFSGGIKNSANFYLAVIILSAFMLLGKKAGIFFTLLSILHLIYFYIIGIYTNWVNDTFIGDSPQLVFLYYFMSTSVSILVLALQSISIERNKNEVIAAIKKNENEIRLKNVELERKNKELEQFAFVASHDLQEPIGTASNFAQLLQRQYRDKLDERGEKYLSFIIQSSERMNTLIKELLDYSRIGHEAERVQIDCNQLINQISNDLKNVIDESQATIVAENLPDIFGYPKGIKQLFQNLVSNSIKFKRQGVKPEIQIRCREENQYFHFSITDNGIGISKEYHDRIFLIFQRLHSRTEFEGSGIGLSHSKKIVELHNGKIWLESTPMVGSTFHFTIAWQT